MTCIVVIEYAGGAVIGADSWIGTEGAKDVLADPPKLYAFGSTIIGASGYTRAFDCLSDLAEVPRRRRDSSAESYVRRVASQAQLVARELKMADESSSAIALCDGKAWVIAADWSVYRSARGYVTCGAGEPFALGALAVLTARSKAPRTLKDARRLCEQALKAAAEHSTCVCRPFHFREQST